MSKKTKSGFSFFINSTVEMVEMEQRGLVMAETAVMVAMVVTLPCRVME